MKFYAINHIDQLLPFIKDKPEFAHRVKDGYQVIDYDFQTKDSFEYDIIEECRGIKFDLQGNIIARPLHKFYNYGEKPSSTDISLQDPHRLIVKLDGSMIHPAFVNGELVFMTRAGITDHSMRAYQEFTKNRYSNRYIDFCRNMIQVYGATPIFEYIAPDNRIVISYDEPQLVLLEIRKIVEGTYFTRAELSTMSSMYDIPLVKDHHISSSDLKSIVDTVRGLVGEEGIIIRFDSGHRVKIKSEDYVTKHKTLAFFNSRDAILDLIFSNRVDDILPILDSKDRVKLESFRDYVNRQITADAFMVDGIVLETKVKELTRKEIALQYAPVNKDYAPAMFQVLDGKNSIEVVKNLLNKRRDLIKYDW